MDEFNDYQPIDPKTTQDSLIPDSENDDLRNASSIKIVLEFFVESVNLTLSCN
jgi:hypothetical protein